MTWKLKLNFKYMCFKKMFNYSNAIKIQLYGSKQQILIKSNTKIKYVNVNIGHANS